MKTLTRTVFATIVCTIVCCENISAQFRNDVVISEIMADPSPVVGLPDAEWIEVINRSGRPISLQGWRLGKNTPALSGPMPSLTLPADSILIITTSSQVAALSPFGRCIAVSSFPSLGNSGDLVRLVNSQGETVHAVDYKDFWHANELKRDGGWSLELIDLSRPCLFRQNWTSSIQPTGGTPGKPNSVAAKLTDSREPRMTNAYPNLTNQLLLIFDHALPASTANSASFSLNPPVTAGGLQLEGPLFNRLQLQLADSLLPKIMYTLTVNGLTDCAGIGFTTGPIRIALPEAVDSGDLMINEVLFDPPPLGYDYVELLNKSNKVLDAGSIRLASRSSTTGQLQNLVRLDSAIRLIFPESMFTYTENVQVVSQQYRVANPPWLFELQSFPSLPNDKGTVVLLNEQGTILDELQYEADWHFALIDNPEGVALERLQATQPTQLRDNWTSAAKSAGYGTPTAQNSQQVLPANAMATLTVSPKVISPDNDGFEDFTLIQINPLQHGFTVNINIFSLDGRPIRVIQRNATLGSNNTFRWDGLDDRQQRVLPGQYIIFADLFDLSGKRQKLKAVVTVATKF